MSRSTIGQSAWGRLKALCKHIFTFLRNNLRLSGLIGATIFYASALTPSLLPRPPLYMGIIAGLAAAIGYLIGLLFGTLYVWIFKKHGSERFRVIVWRIAIVAFPVFWVLMTVQGSRWQNDVRALIGEPALKQNPTVGVIALALLVLAISIIVGRFIKWLYKLLRAHLPWHPPRALSILVSLGVVIFLVWFTAKGLAYNTFIHIANNSYSARNQSTPAGAARPTSPLLSGSPPSLVSWDSLGYMGKNFVSRAVPAKTIEAWSGAPAQDQIRVYVGIDSESTPEKRAKLALAELKRTNAFSRDYLIVATPTGTGWLEPQAVDTLAYVTNGNSAVAAIQYSYLPSWISFLVDRGNSTRAGKALFDIVYDYWITLPENSRPKLITYGLSLGSFGSQGAFSGLSDMTTRMNGALFVGTPDDTENWQYFVSHRQKPSTEILPTVNDKGNIRFAATNSDINKITPAWNSPRILYMQHPSDPVVWWNTALTLTKPDWLKEPRGYDVSKAMQWIPFVTYMQVTVDQFFATTVPNGHGHNYNDTIVAAWQAVLGIDRWSSGQQQSLQNKISSYPIE